MEKAEVVEGNVINSFRLVKADIIRLQGEFMELRRVQVDILNDLAKLNEKTKVTNSVKISKAPKKKVTRSKAVKQIYLASKEGKKFHDPGCNSLKKVPRNKLVSYPTKNKAISKGLQPCGMCIPM